MQRPAEKIIDIIADARFTLQDMNMLGFHIINLSHRQVRKNAIVLADSILYHDANPYYEEVNYEQDALF
jgi:hypothetical protein